MCGSPLKGAAEPTPAPRPASMPTRLVTIQGRLVVQATGAAIPLYGKTEAIIGRGDPSSETFPQIDLTDHGGKQGGVSRLHARLTVQSGRVFIEDLNSTNGTRLNGKRLRPNQPQAIEHGDEITLGWVELAFEQ
jgi:pSer/pThr/pTyr-binding forkhead associated (FHA) protein